MSNRHQLIDPAARLNFSNDWETDWLVEGDTISSRQWTILPAGPTLTNDSSDTVFVEGCEFGMIYHLTEHVVTASGLEDDRTIVLLCQHT